MKAADGLAFVFFTKGGETGLINENEGDIQRAPQTCGRGGIGRRAALRSLWANPRGSSSLLGRTILLLKPAENIAIFPFYAPRVVQMVVLYDESFSSLFVPQTRYLLPPKTHSNGSCAALWGKFHSKIVEDARPSASRSHIQ